MRTWMRAGLILILTAALISLLGLSVAAGAWTQSRQAAPNADTQALGGPAGGGQAMTLVKAEVDKPTAAPGDEVRFFFQIKSTGTRELDGPRLVYDAPAGISILSATSSRGKIINQWEQRADVDVVNLMYNDTVDITIVARIKPTVATGTAIVSDFQISSAYAGATTARLGINVVTPGAKAASALPKTGGGIFLLVLGIILAVSALVLRGLQGRRTTV